MAKLDQPLSPRLHRTLPDWLGEERHQPWTELDRFDRASIAVDCVILTIHERRLRLVIRNRDQDPEQGRWGLPGGFVHWDESIEDAVRRVAKEKVGVGLQPVDGDLMPFVNDYRRDPRGWIFSLAFLAPYAHEELDLPPTTSLALVPLNPMAEGAEIVELPSAWGRLVFEHDRVVGTAIRSLRRQIGTTDVALRFLPSLFTLRQLQDVHEQVTGLTFNRANFRRLATETRGWAQPTGRFVQGNGQRRTELFERQQ